MRIPLILCIFGVIAFFACPSPQVEPKELGPGEVSSRGELRSEASKPEPSSEPQPPAEPGATPEPPPEPRSKPEPTREQPPEPSKQRYTLTVHQGYGSGTYAPGAVVHVWARHDPSRQIVLGWSGDVAGLKHPKEWHTTYTMPANDAALTPQIQAATQALQSAHFQGVKFKKPVLYLLPQAPKGLIFAFHGTGGSHAFLRRLEVTYIARLAYHRGFGVVSLDAQEVQAGDTDKNGKIRWDPDTTKTDNPDFENIRLLVKALVQQKRITGSTPLYAFGMSNGGAFSVSLGHALKLKAATSYCASGRSAEASLTQTPTMWLMCQNDTNPNVSNAKAKQNSDALARRQIDAIYDEHPPSPLYDGRFARIPGINEATSTKLVQELKDRKLVDSRGFFVGTAAAFLKGFQNRPQDFPVLSKLRGALQKAVYDQIRILTADHAMYDDFAARTLDFFEKYP